MKNATLNYLIFIASLYRSDAWTREMLGWCEKYSFKSRDGKGRQRERHSRKGIDVINHWNNGRKKIHSDWESSFTKSSWGKSETKGGTFYLFTISFFYAENRIWIEFPERKEVNNICDLGFRFVIHREIVTPL